MLENLNALDEKFRVITDLDLALGKLEEKMGMSRVTNEIKIPASSSITSRETKPGIKKSKSNDDIDSNANLSPTLSNDELQALKDDKELRRKKIKTSSISTNASCPTPSELNLDVRKRAREAIT